MSKTVYLSDSFGSKEVKAFGYFKRSKGLNLNERSIRSLTFKVNPSL